MTEYASYGRGFLPEKAWLRDCGPMLAPAAAQLQKAIVLEDFPTAAGLVELRLSACISLSQNPTLQTSVARPSLRTNRLNGYCAQQNRRRGIIGCSAVRDGSTTAFRCIGASGRVSEAAGFSGVPVWVQRQRKPVPYTGIVCTSPQPQSDFCQYGRLTPRRSKSDLPVLGLTASVALESRHAARIHSWS